MIGVFDSGIGGLTVLRAIREALPEHAITYLGDSARAPYGHKGRATITEYTQQCCQELFDRGCSLIILACNTASADTLPNLQKEWLPKLQKSVDRPINIIGVIRPLAEEAVLHTHNGCIGVVGTRSTVDSGAYVRELQMQKSSVRVVQQACPLLVPLVEEGWINKPETKSIIRKYLTPLKSSNPDVLVLACTHYETLYPHFVRNMGKRCTVLHSPSIIADKFKEYLQRHPEYDEQIARNGEMHFCSTGDPELFEDRGSEFLGSRIPSVEHVSFVSSIKK